MKTLRLTLFTTLVLPLSVWATIVVPTRTLPQDFDPLKSYDVFSMHVIRQIHGTLFRVNNKNIPEKYLVRTFNVSKNKTLYSFELKQMTFHDGTPLKATHVKKSIERALAAKITGYEQFKCILGFKNFINKTSSQLTGVVIKNNLKLDIHLSCPTPQLIFGLADLRLSIVRPNKPTSGLGLSRLISQSPTEIKLALIKNPAQKFIIKKYEKPSEPLTWVKAGENVAFLLSKPQGSHVITSPLVNHIPVYSLKNYLYAINSRSLPQKKQRAFLYNAIDRKKLLSTCYPRETLSNQIVPLGFPGYSKGNNLKLKPQHESKRITKKIHVVLFRGIGNEACVKNQISKMLQEARIKSNIEVRDSNQGVSGLLSAKYDLAFLYLEAELSMDMLQFYVPSDGFTLGDVHNKKILRNYRKLKKLPAIKFFEKAPAFAQSVLDQLTSIPLFIPRETITLSKKIKPIMAGVYSPTFIDYSDLQVVK